MAATEDGNAIASAGTYTFNGGMNAGDFKKLSFHSVSITGSGSATIAAVFPAGNKALGSIAVGGDDVFYVPGSIGIHVTAVGDSIAVDFYSYAEGE